MAAAILGSWLSQLVAAVMAATAADTWATDTMACTWALSARAFSFLLCLARPAVSLSWNHLLTGFEWRWQLMEFLVASSCKLEMVGTVQVVRLETSSQMTNSRKERRKQEAVSDCLHVGAESDGQKGPGRRVWSTSASPAWPSVADDDLRQRSSSCWSL